MTKTPEQLAEEWARSETAQTLANYYEVAVTTFLGQQKTFQAHIDGQNTGFKNGFLAGYQAAKDNQEYLMNEMSILRSRLDTAEKLSQLVDEEKEQ